MATAEALFVCDAHMGGLARYLRMLGFDTLFDPSIHDDELHAIATEQGRVLLSKDRGLLERLDPSLRYRVAAKAPRLQTVEVLDHYHLRSRANPLSRCLECNTHLVTMSKEAVSGVVPEAILARHNRYRCCPTCGRIYWEGTHFDRMREWTRAVLSPSHTGHGDCSESP